MNPRIRPRRPASIGSNQASPENSPCSAVALLLSLSMAWSPPALERRSWLVEQAGDYATQISHHTRDGTRHGDAPETETETEAETEREASPPARPPARARGEVQPSLPEWLPPEAWAEWCAYRLAKGKKAWTQLAAEK